MITKLPKAVATSPVSNRAVWALRSDLEEGDAWERERKEQ